MEDKKSKLAEIRATAFDVTVIMKQIGTPGFLESLTSIKDTVSQVNEIIQSLQTPEMVKNIENFRILSENFNDSATKMQSTVNVLKESGIIDKTVSLVDSAKSKIDSFDTQGSQGINGVIVSSQEMITSITGLVNEITQTVSYSKRSTIVENIQETIHGASEIYHTISR
ncbi:MAG: hypothetical protein K8Q89_06280 [Nitrosarchaeum sp.]|nr:hypothetical protein [Nitrosarchaeum sp.]